jgi:hypothetical protein
MLAEWTKLQLRVDDLAGYKNSFSSSVRNYWQSNPVGKDDLVREVMAEGVNHRLRAAIQDRYNFNRVRRYLNTLPDNKTKIAYLIEIKTEYLQVGANLEPKTKRFDQKCEMEKSKLEDLVEIDNLGRPMAAMQNDEVTDEKAAPQHQGWSEAEYLIRAQPAAKAIGRRGNKLTDERMAEEMDCSRRTALRYRCKYSNAYNTTVRSGYEEGLKEYTAQGNKT